MFDRYDSKENVRPSYVSRKNGYELVERERERMREKEKENKKENPLEFYEQRRKRIFRSRF